MVSPKIALAMIFKADEPKERVDRCLSSILPHVDAFYATITTEDGKPDLKCSSYKAVLEFQKKFSPVKISWFKWIMDFSAARNFNLKQIPPLYEYIFWCDADDIVIGGECLRALAKMGKEQNVGAFYCTYFYYLSTAGLQHFADTGKVLQEQVMIEHMRERLIKRGLYKWVGRLHETMIEKTETRKVMNNQFSVVHTIEHKDLMSALARNTKILEKALNKETKAGKRDPRTVLHLGKVYFDNHTEKCRKLAKVLLSEYLQTSGWEEERGQAWEYLSTISLEEENHKEALKCAVNSIVESPRLPSGWLQVATCYSRMGQWDKAKFWAEIAAGIPRPQTTLILNPRGASIQFLEIMFGHAVEVNDIDEAYKRAQQIFELAKDHPGAKERLDMMADMKKQKETLEGYHKVATFLSDSGERSKLLPLLAAAPKSIANNQLIEGIRKSVSPPKDWGKKEIAFFCGPSFEKWSAKNMKDWKNLAGSEEATVRLCRELAKIGWEVTVFGNPQDDEGVYAGVKYLPYYKFNPRDTFNVLVIWRQPVILANDYRAKKTYLWMHDIPNPIDFTKDRVKKVEKIIPLSQWHRERLPDIKDDKFMVSANGIDLDQFKNRDHIKRDPYRCIYTSSYDRGLEHLLVMWPDIKKAVPKANLHIFYGWGLFDKMFFNNPERMAWKDKMCNLMKQKGVTEYGKVDQERIVEEYFKAGVWAYPTHFGEISCITAMKCQAAGTAPVVMNYAALKETVRYGRRVEGDIYDQETKEVYKKELILALKSQKWQEGLREKMIPWARKKFGWDKVARQWSREFNGKP